MNTYWKDKYGEKYWIEEADTTKKYVGKEFKKKVDNLRFDGE